MCKLINTDFHSFICFSFLSLFHSRVDAIDQDEHDLFNEVIAEEELLDGRQEYLDNANNLREKHRELKETYNNLKERVVEARTRRQFVEPKVQRLWTVAQESNFSDQELAALKEELFHFESRLLKLSHLHAEHAVSNEKQKVTSVLPQRIDRKSQIIKLTNFCIFRR